MGNAQSLPVIGEAVTVVDISVRVASAGICAVAGNTEAADQLIDGARKTVVNYVEKNVITSTIVVAKHRHDGNYAEAERISNKSMSALEGVVDSTPVVGHAKGMLHYATGDNEHGDRCMKKATRASAVIAGGALTGGLGGVVGGHVADTFITAKTKENYGNLRLIERAVKSDDPNKKVDVFLGFGSDYAVGEGVEVYSARPGEDDERQCMAKLR